ncbi:hypothetical protein GCM10009806_11570 [Microbacterium flavum]|uniref:Sensor-like histidine kinase SenX3 n=2 Tax=Microbacterium flavum TaxID=415216 RepID=A0ABS5XT26_9MICO|nr:GAF domain-containing sensor histidine kinase [Microbacterium flavum]
MSTMDDSARVDAIARYRILGAPAEPNLEGLARLAATLCAVPTAVVNIIDDTRQHQVAAVGVAAEICRREDSMCAVVLQDARHVLVGDARTDARFAQNPFVTGELGRIRFYASSPLVTPDGVSIGTLCVFAEDAGTLTPEQSAALDLLARQAVEVLELRRATLELARSNRQLAQFAGRVSHDLRNPLAAIVGQLDLAAEGLDAGALAQASRAIGRADAAATRMDEMITGLLSYARLGGEQPALTEIPVAGLIAEVIADLHTVIGSTDATVEVDAADGTVVGDRALLRMLVQNLVSNAVKFSAGTAPGAVRPLVQIRARRDVDRPVWSLTVDDNGPGIPAELRDRVFELMERGNAGAVPGLGIGLATCRMIVEAHGGRILVESAPAGGARVRVDLPLRAASAARPLPAALLEQGPRSAIRG